MAAQSRSAPAAILEAARTGGPAEVRGADAVAEVFSGKAQVVRPALVDGIVGAVWAAGGKPRVVFDFTLRDGKIVGIEMLSDPASLDALELTPLG
jgi:RNA polymerase sigma-70 factor (ECF subfamily)